MSTDKEDDAVASVLLALRSKWAAGDIPPAPDLVSAPGSDSAPGGSRKRVRELEGPELTAAAGVYCVSFTHMVSCVSLSLLNALSSALSISHTLTITCTCCCDGIYGAQDLKISHAHSLTLTLTLTLSLSLSTSRSQLFDAS